MIFREWEQPVRMELKGTMNIVNRHVRFILLLGWAGLLGGPAAATNVPIRVGAVVQDETIYVGEPFQYYLVIEGRNEEVKVDTGPLAAWSPRYLGGQDRSRRTYTIFGSQKREHIERKYVMIYQLTAQQAGRAVLPAVSLEIEGKTYRTKPVTINVLAPLTDERLRLEMALAETSCYVGQPIEMTLTWFIHGSLAQRIGNMDFTIPVLDDEENFVVEDATEPPGGMGKAVQFTLRGDRVMARQGRSGEYITISFSKILIPRRAGRIAVAGPTLRCMVAVEDRRQGRDPFRDFFGDDFFSSPFRRREYRRYVSTAREAVLEVKPLPSEGQPTDFYGLVGRYTVTASATPTKVNVGDPITLTIAIGGALLKQVKAPELEAVEELEAHFKIASEQAVPKVSGGQKIFTQTIRAKDHEVRVIPAIPLSYFDVDKGRYATARSTPIPLEVAVTENVGAEQAVGREATNLSREIEAVREGIAANEYDQTKLLSNAAFAPGAALWQPGYLLLWAGPLAVFALTAALRLLTSENPQRAQARRQGTAARRAARQLKRLDQAAATDEMAAALRQYVGDRFDRSAASLTSRDCREILGAAGGEAELVDRFCEALEGCEQSRFAGGGGPGRTIGPDEAAALVRALDGAIKKAKK